MRARATAGRRLAAVLAGVALLALGAPLHHHLGVAGDATPSLSAQSPLASTTHARTDCPACQSGSRPRLGLGPALVVVRAAAVPALRLAAPGGAMAPPAASHPPTPPRGPPAPFA